MKRYSLEELKDPKTYQDNPKLATVARRLVDTHHQIVLGNLRMGEFKRRILDGHYPELVKKLWDKHVDDQEALEQALKDSIRFAETFTPPEPYRLEIADDEVLVKGSYCPDLAKRLKRQGGYWDGARYENRKCFAIPLEKATSLKRIFTNWTKGQPKRDAEKARQEKKKTLAEIRRWLGYVESAAEQGRVYDKGVDKLRRELHIEDYPDQDARLSELLAMAGRIQREAAAKPGYGQSWNARQPDCCRRCEGRVEVGEAVRYRYQDGCKYLEHLGCEAVRAEKDRRQAEAPFVIAGGSACGHKPYQEGQVVKADQGERGQENYPEFLYVVRCSEQYFKEDGLSFGVGDDSGYIYRAECRAATEEEAAPLKAEIELKQEKHAAERERTRIGEEIKTRGELPDGPQPKGQRVSDRQNIYGGGDWFVIENEWIWYVRNNGADGDNWLGNNVRTGGAGALGWRMPFDPDVAGRLRKIATLVDPDEPYSVWNAGGRSDQVDL